MMNKEDFKRIIKYIIESPRSDLQKISRLQGDFELYVRDSVTHKYSKKYILEKIEEFNQHNPIYEGVLGRICYPAYFNVGERGWFLWIEDGWFKEFAHRIHTSLIESVEYLDNGIIVATQNTRFTFKLLEG